jgi:NADH:ubiquinone reductase (non-electrogenic)
MYIIGWRVSYFLEQKNVDVRFCEAECYKIDAENKKIYCRSTQDKNLNGVEEFVLDYDYLVIGIGARVNTFNTPGVEENCHFLKVTSLASLLTDDLMYSYQRFLLQRIFPKLSPLEKI